MLKFIDLNAEHKGRHYTRHLYEAEQQSHDNSLGSTIVGCANGKLAVILITLLRGAYEAQLASSIMTNGTNLIRALTSFSIIICSQTSTAILP